MQLSDRSKRGRAQGRNRRKQSGRRFIQLYSNVKRSDAYHSLSALARCAMIEVLDKYTGINNGMIVMSVRDLAERLNCSRNGASRALRDLDDAGLVRPMEVGTLKGRRASTYRLTFYRCDKTGYLPTSRWPERLRTVPPESHEGVVASPQRATKDLTVPPESHKRQIPQ